VRSKDSARLLSGITLSHATLSGAHLPNADLSGADLSGAGLSSADLSNAYLIKAYLSEAILSGAFLSEAEGITNEDLEQQAKFLEGATMPNGQKYEDWLKSKDQEENKKSNGSS
jgi:uncharacterized protein YjbI with pentapeptide repeats